MIQKITVGIFNFSVQKSEIKKIIFKKNIDFALITNLKSRKVISADTTRNNPPEC